MTAGRAGRFRASSGDTQPLASDERGDFRLLRYFAIASLVAIVLAGSGMAIFFRQTALKQLVKVGEDNNVALAYALSATLRPHYAPLIDAAKHPGAGQASDQRHAALLHQAVLDVVRESRLLRVRIYDAEGRPIYASDSHPRVGEVQADPGFAAARRGAPSTSLNHPDSFDEFGLILTHPSVLTSHVPVRRAGEAELEAVLEVASDVTPFYEEVRRTQTQLRYAGLTMLVLLYGALFFAVKRAESVIKGQDEQRRRDADTIRHLAHHDELTGLPNRKLFTDRLSCAVERAKRSGNMVALMFIDLDHFKEVNDTLGHVTGDRVLQAAGSLLRESLRTADTVARMGGDEFTIILEDVADLDRVETVAQKIAKAFIGPVAVENGVNIFVTPSTGIALFPRDGEDAEALLNAADAAMYEAKNAGRNAYRFHGPQPAAAAVAEPDPVVG